MKSLNIFKSLYFMHNWNTHVEMFMMVFHKIEAPIIKDLGCFYDFLLTFFQWNV